MTLPLPTIFALYTLYSDKTKAKKSCRINQNSSKLRQNSGKTQAKKRQNSGKYLLAIMRWSKKKLINSQKSKMKLFSVN